MDGPWLGAGGHDVRVFRAFGFLDVCGFTDFIDHHGDAAGVAELRLLRSAVREVAPVCGVRVDKWLGDGAMLVGVDVEPVVAAVVAVRERNREVGRLPLRAGLAAGGVIILEGDDYVGRAVNLAARLCDEAGPDEILAAGEGLRVPGWVQEGEPRVIAVRGLARPVPAVSLTAAGSDRSPSAA